MASRGVNKVILVGNLGNDPEVRYMPNGGAVANISVATSESWKDKQSGQMQERTEWHRVVFFNRLAEIVGEYVRKGSKLYIEGALRTRQWEKDGVTRYTTEIVASEMQMLDSRQGPGVAPGMGGGHGVPDYPEAQMGGGFGGGQQGGGFQSQQQPQQGFGQQGGSMPNQQPQHGGGAPQQQNQQQGMPGGFDDFDDDIPF